MEMRTTQSPKGRRRASDDRATHFNHSDGFPRQKRSSTNLTGQDNFRARSQPDVHSPGLVSNDPPRPHGSSLNRFKVLPPIERGCPVDPGVSGLSLTELHISKTKRVDGSGLPTECAPDACSLKGDTKGALSRHTLLLAVKDPGGRRFEQRFNSTDTLIQVRASAEAKFGARYGDSASIETMEVPRRSFTDMSRTLSQCGIMDRSVLCIYQPQDD